MAIIRSIVVLVRHVKNLCSLLLEFFLAYTDSGCISIHSNDELTYYKAFSCFAEVNVLPSTVVYGFFELG